MGLASVGGREGAGATSAGWASGTSLTLEEPLREGDERLSCARARAQSQQMGEAPVKYELTGASCLCRTEARDVA